MKLLGNRLLIQPLPRANASVGGVLIPANYTDPSTLAQYQVLAVGTGKLMKHCEISVGDFVLASLHHDHLTLPDGSKIVGLEQIELQWSSGTKKLPA